MDGQEDDYGWPSWGTIGKIVNGLEKGISAANHLLPHLKKWVNSKNTAGAVPPNLHPNMI